MKVLIILIRFNKVANIYDPNSHEKILHYLLPIGLACISSYLKRAGKDVTVINLNNKDGYIKDIIKEEMEKEKYDIAFVGGLSLFYPHLRDLIGYIHKYSPTTKVVAGGGIITAQPEIMFNLLKPDYGIIGEGEETALELVNFIENGGDRNKIDGLIFSYMDSLVITSPRKAIMDLDSLPYPDYDSFGYSEYLNNIRPTDYVAYDIVDDPRFYPVLASRSCPYDCTFCFHPLGRKYRQRSIDNIMDEIKQNVEKYNINIIFTYDELFSNSRDRVFEFCTKFKAYSDTLPYKLWFYCNNRADTTTNEMLKIMKASGAYLLSFGLESYSETVLKSMKKHTKPEDIKKIVHLMKENELGLQGSFIFGDVAETCETAKETLKFVRENRKDIGTAVSTVFIVPFQGSPIYKYCVNNGKIKDEVQFIMDREASGYDHLHPQLNMSDHLTDEEFSKLKSTVLKSLVASDVYSTPMDYWKTDNGDTFVKVKCPRCKKVSTIKNTPIPKIYFAQVIGCRHCFYRFDLAAPYYPLWRLFVKIVGYDGVQWLSKMKTYMYMKFKIAL